MFDAKIKKKNRYFFNKYGKHAWIFFVNLLGRNKLHKKRNKANLMDIYFINFYMDCGIEYEDNAKYFSKKTLLIELKIINSMKRFYIEWKNLFLWKIKLFNPIITNETSIYINKYFVSEGLEFKCNENEISLYWIEKIWYRIYLNVLIKLYVISISILYLKYFGIKPWFRRYIRPALRFIMWRCIGLLFRYLITFIIGYVVLIKIVCGSIGLFYGDGALYALYNISNETLLNNFENKWWINDLFYVPSILDLENMREMEKLNRLEIYKKLVCLCENDYKLNSIDIYNNDILKIIIFYIKILPFAPVMYHIKAVWYIAVIPFRYFSPFSKIWYREENVCGVFIFKFLYNKYLFSNKVMIDDSEKFLEALYILENGIKAMEYFNELI